MQRPILSLEHVSKSYPGVVALDDVTLTLLPGEVLGLVGENGAGKSTLIKIITGATRPDAGTVRLDGAEMTHTSPASAIEAGVSAIYQEFSLFPELTVAENLFYGRELKRGPFLDRRRMNEEARGLLGRVGAAISPNVLVRDLSVGHQQLVELAKAISRRARVLIMDEPTAPLTNREVDFLYRAVRALAAEGVSILYVSHRLEEIFDLCDRVMVLRDGRHVRTAPIAELDRNLLIELMVGRTLDEEFPPSRATPGPVVLDVRNLRSEAVDDVSFQVRAGEILGIGGLVGAGRTETARLIFGADKRTGGEIRIDGEVRAIDAPLSAIRDGIGLVPEDRKHQGALLGQNIRFNIVYAALGSISRWGFVRRGEEQKAVDGQVRALRIKTPSIDQDVSNLSGGNQQ
ncbi:MAG: sugar ABC transporter ATP-binding protein, partial [Bauldia sp.]|nr:sugar ABC transporter ATP-binding protein [Bauldia sp.]